jgi:hypothetical protein
LGFEAGFDDATVFVEEEPVGVALDVPRLDDDVAMPVVDDDREGEVIVALELPCFFRGPLEVDPNDADLVLPFLVGLLDWFEDVADLFSGGAGVGLEEEEGGFAA